MKGFDAALRMEWVRISTVRSTAALIGLALLLGTGVAVVLASATRGEPADPEVTAVVLTSGGAFVPLPFAAVFMAVLAVLNVGHDYRHGLVRPVLAVVPGRSAVLLARMYVLATVSAAVTVVSLLLNGLAALVVGGAAPRLEGGVLRALAGYVLLVVLWAWLAAGATWLLRSTAAVLTGLFLLPLVVEPLLQALTMIDALRRFEPVVDRLPFASGRLMVLTGNAADATGAAISALEGGALFAGFVAALVVAGWIRFGTTDA